MDTNELYLNLSDYARARGCSAAYVSKLRRNRRLVLDERGRVAVRASDELVRSTARRAKVCPKISEPAPRWRDIELKVRDLLAVCANHLGPKVSVLQSTEQCNEMLTAQLQGLAPAIVRLVVKELEGRLDG